MGTSALYSWAAADRAEERQGEQDDDFDAALATETARQAAAIRTNCITGHKQTLSDIAEDLAHAMSQDGITEHLIRTATACGPLAAGYMLMVMITKAIDARGETAALAELERDERGGLDFSKMQRADSALVVPA